MTLLAILFSTLLVIACVLLHYRVLQFCWARLLNLKMVGHKAIPKLIFVLVLTHMAEAMIGWSASFIFLAMERIWEVTPGGPQG